MFNNFFANITLEDVLRYLRTIIQFIAGTSFGSGLLSGEQWQLLVGAAAGIISFLWTLKANTLTNKVIEVEKSAEIKAVVPAPSATSTVKEAASGTCFKSDKPS